MKNRLFKITVLFLSIITLNSCVFSSSGDSLESFSQRMNSLNESYNMTSEGYIMDSSDNSLTKFFKFSDNEIMLKFRHDTKNRLNEMHIVFDSVILNDNENCFVFISDCIECFCQNEVVSEEILNASDFENSIRTIKKETISAEADNIKMEIDTTQLGTVVSLYKDI